MAFLFIVQTPYEPIDKLLGIDKSETIDSICEHENKEDQPEKEKDVTDASDSEEQKGKKKICWILNCVLE